MRKFGSFLAAASVVAIIYFASSPRGHKKPCEKAPPSPDDQSRVRVGGGGLDKDVTEWGASITLIGALLMLVIGVWAVGGANPTNEALFDYLAYILPCLAAIVAGLTAYLPKARSHLFVLSLAMLYCGVMAYVYLKPFREEVASAITAVGLLFVIFAAGFRCQRFFIATWNRDPNGPLPLWIYLTSLTFLFTVLSTLWIVSFAHFNIMCIRGIDVGPECRTVWWWWRKRRLW